MIEYVAVLLIAVLAVILSLQNKRMAKAIRGIEGVVHDYYAMQIRARRTQQTREIDASFNAYTWISAQVSAGLPAGIAVRPEINGFQIFGIINKLGGGDLPLAGIQSRGQ